MDGLKCCIIVRTSSTKNPKHIMTIISPPTVAPASPGINELQVIVIIARIIMGANTFINSDIRVIISPFSPTQIEKENPVFLKYHR